MATMQPTSELPNIARIGALIGNPVRAQFIGTLMDGSERSASELAALLKRLETLGYIRRARDAADERQVCINLTEAGRTLRSRASDVVRHVRDATGVQDRKMKQLLKDLGALRRALESYTSE